MSLASSQFLGLRLAPTPRSSAHAPSPFSTRSLDVCAAYSAASDRAHAGTATIASPSSSSSSLYDALGVPPTASTAEIKAAYRRLALKCHPDVVATGRRGASSDEFMRVQTAYATLSDSERRADYDRRLTNSAAMLVRSPRQAYARSTSFPGYSRRTWETDQCW
ncbi:chaperone protein dnaJ 11, chloroplastic-like [Curcuma longa]|uniref:chaperone protein dnaJ 11, chloroplastic-like n=1 Tax=Curcuma longa TaxID=136217 RepID=UPI003D9EE650